MIKFSVFVDTGVIVAVRNEDDENHERGKELMKRALKGDFGTVHTSDYVFDEATTLALVRTGDPDLAIDVGKFVANTPRIRMLQVTREDYRGAWEKFKSLSGEGLSFTDCSTLQLMESNKVEKLMSFDSGFDGLADRIP